MSGESKRIDINVGGRADLTQAGGEISRFRTLINELKKDAKSVGEALKEAKQNWRDLTLVGAAHAGKQAMDYTRQLTTSNLSGGAMYGKVAGGLAQYKDHIIQIDNEARAVKRLGEAYRDYHRDLIASGRPYGFSNNQVLALASTYSQTNGRAGTDRLLDDMQVTQGMARAYGMQATEAGSYLNQANKAGIIGPGGDISSMRQFSGLLADAISAGRMQGREGEVMSSVVELTRAINAQRVDVKGTDLAARALTTLNATGIRGLQGDQGAALLGRMDNAIKNPGGGEAGDLFMYRALTNGQGGMSLADYSYLKEEGLAGQTPDGRSNLQAVMEQVNTMPISGRYRLMAASNLTGMSMHQYEGLENAFMKDGKFDMAKLGNLQNALGQNMGGVDASVWSLLADLQNGVDVGAVGKEFAQLSGQTAATNKDELFNQIKQYGQGNVALSEGQQREKLDADMGKAAEDAASKLYGLQTAADELAKKFLEIGGALPGPLGGVAPALLGSAAGGLLQKGGNVLAGKGADLLGRAFGMGGSAAAAGEAAAVGEAGTAAAGIGGLGVLGLTTAIGGGVIAGSVLSDQVYGNRSNLLDALGTAGSYTQNAIGEQWNNLTSGNWRAFAARGQQVQTDLANTGGALTMAGPAALAGTLYGAYQNFTGQQDFQSAYRDAFFNVDRFDSTGRREWQAAQNGGGGAGQGWGSPTTPLAADGQDRSGRLPAAGMPTPTNGMPLPAQMPSSAGGWWNIPADDMPALLHRKEMVLPRHLADPLRDLITGPQLSTNDARQGAGMIQVQIAPIKIEMPDGSTQTVNASGSYTPFDGIIAHPTLSSR